MKKLRRMLLRAGCVFAHLILIGHDYEQIYDEETWSWALVCRRCEKVDDIHLYKKGQFADEQFDGMKMPPPAPPKIQYGFEHGVTIERRKVKSVSEAISLPSFA